MTSALETLINRHVDRGTVPGAVGLLGSVHTDDVELVAAGSMTAAPDGPPMRTDAIFRIQSMTKAVTTVAALRLVESGAIALDDPVTSWLPQLADRRVLVAEDGPLDDTVPARRDITLRDLLTNRSGYGMVWTGDSPLQLAMATNQTEAGADPVAVGADEWLSRLADLPLLFHPGEGWRYHHSFGILGVLLSRVVGRPLGDHLADDLFGPLDLRDSGFFVPQEKADRLPAAFQPRADDLVESEPAGGGFYAGPPPFDVAHAELVSTARDYHRFLQALGRGELVSADHFAAMTSDQVEAPQKTASSFFPGFWDESGWGFGVGVMTAGAHRGRYGWSGGQGTTFYVDPDGTIALLLTQVELGERMGPVLSEFETVTRA